MCIASILTLCLYSFLNDHFDAVACDYHLVDDDENIMKTVNCDESL